MNLADAIRFHRVIALRHVTLLRTLNLTVFALRRVTAHFFNECLSPIAKQMQQKASVRFQGQSQKTSSSMVTTLLLKRRRILTLKANWSSLATASRRPQIVMTTTPDWM